MSGKSNYNKLLNRANTFTGKQTFQDQITITTAIINGSPVVEDLNSVTSGDPPNQANDATTGFEWWFDGSNWQKDTPSISQTLIDFSALTMYERMILNTLELEINIGTFNFNPFQTLQDGYFRLYYSTDGGTTFSILGKDLSGNLRDVSDDSLDSKTVTINGSDLTGDLVLGFTVEPTVIFTEEWNMTAVPADIDARIAKL